MRRDCLIRSSVRASAVLSNSRHAGVRFSGRGIVVERIRSASVMRFLTVFSSVLMLAYLNDKSERHRRQALAVFLACTFQPLPNRIYSCNRIQKGLMSQKTSQNGLIMAKQNCCAAQHPESNGRPVGTRTPDLYRVNVDLVRN
jgi:hypothetical protein